MEKNGPKTLLEGGRNPLSYFLNYGQYVARLLSSLDYDSINNVVECFIRARELRSTIYFAGNGGSAATASHFAQDLGEVGRKTKGKLFRTVSLTDNVSFITAMGNDYGYENIFTGQMSNLFGKDDVLVAISASGNSPNVVEAARLAKQLGGVTVGLVGFDGGKLSELCDHVIHVETNKGEYGPVEDIHLIIDHMITSHIILKELHDEYDQKKSLEGV